MRRLMRALGSLGILACSSDSTAPESISGNWTFSDATSSAQLSGSCHATGTIRITQTGSSFTGTVVSGSNRCTVGTQSSTGSIAGSAIGHGRILAPAVSFTDNTLTEADLETLVTKRGGGCKYTGTISGSPVNQMTGDETCIVALSDTYFLFSGTWQLNK